jgi:methyl-accepting chemotaxis protein
MSNQPTRKFAAKIIRSTLPGAIAAAVCGAAAVLWLWYFDKQFEIHSPMVHVAMGVCVAIGAAACVISILVPRSLAHKATELLEVLARATRRSKTTGDIHVSDDMRKLVRDHASDEDEIADVCAAFVTMMDGHMKKVAILEQIARGDLTHRVDTTSDLDVLGNAINDVVTSISQIVREVKVATAQFAVGVREMSNGAQSLSQSSTEQAATVDQLQISVGDIASEAEANATKAAQASKLTAAIRESAGDGRKQMENMSASMREITDANHSIGTVMRAIDEIAFQTNILALNAAVEAARAGAHGRGFAVVADEVRNLANKSGSAASESNAVIIDTIAKSDDGMKIVEDVRAFFRKIEEGISTTSGLLDEIAFTAKNQSDSIDMINTFISNLTNVVLLNNATSEQSAAASEEMNNRALILEESVNRFKLDDDSSQASVPKPQIVTPPPASAPPDAPAFVPPVAAASAPPVAAASAIAPQALNHEPDIDASFFEHNPVNEPTPEAGGRTPAEIYAEALGKKASIAPGLPTPPTVQTDGFKDDESKYW